MKMLAVFWFMTVAVTAIAMVASILRKLTPDLRSRSWLARTLLLISLSGAAILLLRPHEDTFTGLDVSGYRLMAGALAEGHALKGVDQTLLDVPLQIRNQFLYFPHMMWRNSRDISFQVVSLERARTQPYFYPLLPLYEIGFDMAIPGHVRDYGLPVLGWLFFATCLTVGCALGGIAGLCVAIVLLVGSPVLTWFFRGYFPEAAGVVLIGLVLLAWSLTVRGRITRLLMYLGLGLAVSFHPLLIVLSLPALLIIVLSTGENRGGMFAGILVFTVGVLPLVLVTQYVSQPYGDLLNIKTLIFNCRVSGEHRAVTAFAAACVLFVIAMLLAPRATMAECKDRAVALLTRPWILESICALLLLALSMSCAVGHQAAVMRYGCLELYESAGMCFGFAVLAGIVAVVVSREYSRSHIMLLLFFSTLPVFVYLKGLEPYGLWSERRLLPAYVLLMATLIPSAVYAGGALVAKWRFLRLASGTCGLILLAMAAFANFARWPTPYVVRYDAGAQAWVDRISARIGQKLAFFDSYQLSVPFAVRPGLRALGAREANGDGEVSGVMAWLAERARQEETIWITSYANPGIEDGVVLKSAGRESVSLSRERSKYGFALPAVEETYHIDVELLRPVPLIGDAVIPSLNKVFDGGPLALRPPWGRSDIPVKLPNGRQLPAQWSREGSGIIGPVPRPGGAVRINVIALTGRTNLMETQILRLQPPWGGEPLALTISNNLTDVSGELVRPADQPDDGVRTGVYRIHSAKPYDPLKDGIRKFNSDLGALIHRINMELIPAKPSGF
jgi:hypothetical protein